MNILHIYKDYHPVLGGIENHIRWLAVAQAKLGHSVSVLVTSPNRRSTQTEEDGVSIIRASRIAHVASTPLSLSLPALLRRRLPDIAHVHSPYPVGEVSQWLLGRSRRTVLSYHSDVVRQARILKLYAPLLRRVLRETHGIIAATPQYRDSSLFLQPHADKCRVIPYGIDLQRFATPDLSVVRSLREMHFPDDSGLPLLLFVGRLRYYKGLRYLIQSMPSIRAVLLIVGTGPEERQLRSLAAATGVSSKVHFVGEVHDDALPSYYHAADLFVLPACERSEAFGIVMVEAMASGTALVSTELGTGTSFVNLHGQTGLVVPPRDPPALAYAINRLLGNASQRMTMGEAARARAKAEFSLAVMTERIIALYEELLAGPGLP